MFIFISFKESIWGEESVKNRRFGTLFFRKNSMLVSCGKYRVNPILEIIKGAKTRRKRLF